MIRLATLAALLNLTALLLRWHAMHLSHAVPLIHWLLPAFLAGFAIALLLASRAVRRLR